LPTPLPAQDLEAFDPGESIFSFLFLSFYQGNVNVNGQVCLVLPRLGQKEG
jgi:hypothetical protein